MRRKNMTRVHSFVWTGTVTGAVRATGNVPVDKHRALSLWSWIHFTDQETRPREAEESA